MKLTLQRFTEANGATMGRLFVPGQKQAMFTLEHAWLNNADDSSCIPEGAYKCIPHGWEPDNPNHFSKTQVWEVAGVPGRTGVLFHVGNTLKDTHGCILVGFGMMIDGQASSVTQSAGAVEMMRRLIGWQGFDLEVVATPRVAA